MAAAMELTSQMRQAIDDAVLCWLATASREGAPNVSPKEVFGTVRGDIVIADIASPRSVRNIAGNEHVAVAVLDVFAQEGWSFTGRATLVRPGEDDFTELAAPLEAMTDGQYVIRAVIRVTVEGAQRIVAPSSWVFPDRPAEVTRAAVLARYGVRETGT